MSISEARKKTNAEHDKKNFEYITLKARRGSRERIVQAAAATGQSINGFIRGALNEAVEDVLGSPMELTDDTKKEE